MAKEPRVGHVKTRLGRDIGAVPATWWFRHQMRMLLRRLQDPRWDMILALSPQNAALTRAFPLHFARMGQGQGDLGKRMARVFRQAPAGPALIMGADIPGVSRANIAHGFDVLRQRDFVFGPAPDGGFWSVGAARRRALPPKLFAGARWSTEHALGDSLGTLNNQSHGLIAELGDIDTGADLERWMISTRRRDAAVIGPKT